MSDEILGYAIARLSLSPGDVLVVKCHHWRTIKPEWAAKMKEQAKNIIGDIPLMIIGSDVDLAVLTKPEIEAHIKDVRMIPDRIIELPKE